MAFEIPTALIRDLQIRLRDKAGIRSYDSSTPPLPSIADAVAGFDRSLPPHLRCTRCRAGLLRGLQSTICVFCGAEQRRDGAPLSISFNSTLARRNLLDSLGLDGSEPVTLEPEINESSKNRDAPKDELVLSNLLDLELKWPLDKEVVADSSAKMAPSQSMPALNLSGVDLDKFFTEKETARDAPGSSNEPSIPEKKIAHPESDLFSGSENFSFSANLHSSDATKSSVDAKGGQFDDSFADWEADFQSANSEGFAVDTKTVDLFKVSPAVEDFNPESTAEYPNLDEHIEPEMNNKGTSEEPTKDGGRFSLSGSWVPDDVWSNMNTEVSKAAGKFKSTSQNDNGESKNQINDTISLSDERVLDNPWPVSSNKDSTNTRDVEDSNDLFDDWQDFTSSGAQPNVSSFQEQSHIRMPTNEQSSQTDSANIQDMEFGDFFVSNAPLEAQVHNSAHNEKEFSNTKSMKENDGFFDDWQDFAHSGKASTDNPNVQTQTGLGTTIHDKSLETKSGGFQDIHFGDFMLSDSTSRVQDGGGPSSSRKESNVNSINKDDLFDSWQDFTNLGAAPGGLLNPQPLAGVGTSFNEDFQEMNSTNLQDTEVGFSHSKVLSEVEPSQKGSTEANSIQPITSAFHRMSVEQEKINGDSTIPDAPVNNDHFSSASQQESTEATVDMLLSRMPDLSFMLAGDLSIPKAANNSNPNS
ncbi:hypothetical protein J5N97_026804 [Dioscorea zingiberensis]|uniref:DUF7815 domain-containing protein n=1 Tax=Dioscorea zingiberensis TaxID=325984 RepID=A0A9D5C2V7_9LILI|nr:hypothetical protein J5N97_026804 [Dioscorea zingiberensis]